MSRTRRLFEWSLPLLALVLLALPALSQGRFSPVISVNDKAITAYELDQRIRLLQALGAPGDHAREARSSLIDERLQVQAAEDLGITLTEEGIREGVAEYAQRSNTDADTFLEAIGQAGIDQRSFLDFIEAGLLWREVVRVRFGPQSRASEEEVDRALALAGQVGGARVLISEIILPARTPEEAARAEALAADIRQTPSFEAFSAAARRYSASATAQRGGRVDWLPLTELPPPLRTELLTLPPGGIAEPFRIQGAVAVFQLRALEELPLASAAAIAIDYAQFLIPGGTEADASEIAGRIDTCDDLYGIAHGLPEERLIRETLPPSEIAADIAAELQRLDEDEVSTSLRRGNSQVLLMLCGRTTEEAEALDRGAIRRQLTNLRASSYSEAFLAELRADAVITEAE